MMKTSLDKEDLSHLNQTNPLMDKSIRITELEEQIEKLNFICSNLDPFAPISEELKQLVKSFNIVELDDPFVLTKQLVVLLEDAVEELHGLDPKYE
ncbi:MAG: hypothetical protein KC493_06420 [Bacteriovoracaceae bacterium]|nr:hypothetical protein [Bacteriovoracaceae bacterium]